MFFSLPRLKFWLIIVLIVGLTHLISPLRAQALVANNSASVAIKNVSTFLPALSGLSNSTEATTTEWIRLDGRRLFQITAAKELLPERVQTIQNHLAQISDAYLQNSSNYLQVNVSTVNDSPIININGQYILTVTELDAKQRSISTYDWAVQLSEILKQALIKAKQERQPGFLLKQSAIACATILAIAMVNWLLLKQRRRIRLRETEVKNSNIGTTGVRSIKQKFHQNLKAFENRLLLYVQVLLCLGGIFA